MTAVTARDAAYQRKHTCSPCLHGRHDECTLPGEGRCTHFGCDGQPPVSAIDDVVDRARLNCPTCGEHFRSEYRRDTHVLRAHGNSASPAPAAAAPTLAAVPTVVPKKEPQRVTDDEIEIEWIDQLPPRSEAVGALYRIASALRSNPGRWAKVPKVCNTVSTATTSANVMRKEYPLPDWEITTRGTMIYARYLG